MKKLEKINLSQNNIDEKLNTNSNKIKKILSDEYNFKENYIIAESDWFPSSITTEGRTTTPNQFVSATVDINQFLDFKLDYKFVPFINVELITKTPEGVESVGFLNHTRNLLEGDYVEVYGNGTELIYKGSPVLYNGSLYKYQLTAGQFQESFTKARYNTTFIYTYLGEEYKVKPRFEGILDEDYMTQIQIFFDTVVHHGDEFQSSILVQQESKSTPSNKDKIINVTNDTITLNGELKTWVEVIDTTTHIASGWHLNGFYTTYIPTDGNSSVIFVHVNGASRSYTLVDDNEFILDEPAEEGDIIEIKYYYLTPKYEYVENITKNFIDIDDYAIRQKYLLDWYKKVNGSWIYNNYYNNDFDSHNGDVEIISANFSFLGYNLYYDDNTIDLFDIADASPVVEEGDFHKKILTGLPVDKVPPEEPYNPLHRKWNTITFLRNPNGHPESYVEEIIEDAANKDYVLIKTFKSDNQTKDDYRIILKGKLVFKLLADNISSFEYYPVYNHTYIKSSDSYINSSDSYTLKVGAYYTVSSFPNIEYKIRISLINPYNFNTRNNYEL